MFLLGENKNLVMYEGDFGENIGIKVINNPITDSTLKFFISDDMHNVIIEKTPVKQGELYYVNLTQEESRKLPEGNYLFGIKQYKNDVLIETLLANKIFYVIRG